tara:strand:- start:1872 stop:2069 length:198 start_codon:yes stop_codon:yes gene_type:complete
MRLSHSHPLDYFLAILTIASFCEHFVKKSVTVELLHSNYLEIHKMIQDTIAVILFGAAIIAACFL